jgi:hypothetical protein
MWGIFYDENLSLGDKSELIAILCMKELFFNKINKCKMVEKYEINYSSDIWKR